MSTLKRSKETDRRYFGVAEAVVMENIDPDGEGKVRVRFPWFDEETVSDWCRVAQFYAGPDQCGAVFVPEIDAEVLVAFIHGDMRKPIIIGSLYNGIDKPATARESSRDEKQLRTRTGHRITLVDTQGEEKVVIADNSGAHLIELNTVENSLKIQSQGGKLSLSARDIEITADLSLKIDATTIEQTATAGMNLQGKPINLN